MTKQTLLRSSILIALTLILIVGGNANAINCFISEFTGQIKGFE